MSNRFAGAALLLAVLSVPARGQDVVSPDNPGASAVWHDGARLLISNAVICASWRTDARGLRPEPVRDLVGGTVFGRAGECFEIVLTNGQKLAASVLEPDGPARLTDLKPDATSARFAGRIPGRQAEMPFRSSDGRLHAAWRVLLLDGANYFRQELAITAGTEDCAIREILWLHQPALEARQVGRVDGSPVVSGNFFLGVEDPHALNGVSRPSQELGGWSPADLALGQQRAKRWPLDARILQAGTNEFVFQYERGPHRLDIWRTALLEDGDELAHQNHHGRTGSEHVNNTYSLVLPRVKPGAHYELAAQLGTDPALKLAAGRSVESYGKVYRVGTGATVLCRLPRNTVLRRGETLTHSFVTGVAPAGQMRRAFLSYLERERAHPYRPYLHYNSWYDTAWEPFALNETNCLEAIRLFGERLIKPHGVVLDALVFDDGWDNPKTLWGFHGGFPRGFAPLADACRDYHTRLGVWLSPFGGYGEPRNQRLKFAPDRGFETNATGFSLAGPNYYEAFKAACVGMIRNYGVNHFKFDGIAGGMYANGGAQYVLDTEAMRRLMLELRREDPNLYINLTTGSWPSPFWLRYADSVWRQGGDMGHAGKGSKQQQWLTYRDQETYRNVVRKGPLYPLNSLMTQGVAYSKHGMAGDPTFNSAGFKDDVRAFFASGTGLQELYIQPARLTTDDWRVLAEAAKWSRANADVLVDTHWIGGDPSRLEVYGYASWSARRSIVMLRNPDDQEREFALDIGKALELPSQAARRYRLTSPWADAASEVTLTAAAGRPLNLVLRPFVVLVFEATPLPQ